MALSAVFSSLFGISELDKGSDEGSDDESDEESDEASDEESDEGSDEESDEGSDEESDEDSELDEWRRWPNANRILIDERNLYLTAMLKATERQLQKCSKEFHPSGFVAPVIVAVVGMSQQKGIIDLLQERESPLRRIAKRIEFKNLQKIPPYAESNRLFAKGLTFLIYCLKIIFIRWVAYYIAGIDFIDMSNHEADSLVTSHGVSNPGTDLAYSLCFQ